MRVRLIETGDKTNWLRLRSSLWPKCPPERHLQEMEEILAHISATPVFVSEDDAGNLCGFLEASLHASAEGCETGDPIGYIEGWYVEPDKRRLGIGKTLVRMAEAWAILQGCQEMASDSLIDNTAGIDAHFSLGYRETERLIHFRKSLLEIKSTRKPPSKKR